MSTRDRLSIAAALAVVLASASLIPVFDSLGWLLRGLGAVAVVAACCVLARRAGGPQLLGPFAGVLGLAAYVCLVFAGPTLALGLLPTAETLRSLRDTMGAGLLDVQELAAPVPTRAGLVLLTVLGVGTVAVLVDALAVTARHPAVAGLPLLLLFAVPAATLPDGLGWWPFVLGAVGWLGLLLIDGSDTTSRWGTPLRKPDHGAVPRDASLGRVGRRIGAAALGVALVVPALIPGLDGRLSDRGFGAGGSGGSRSTTTYNPILELGGQLRLPEPGRLLMSYETDDPSPDYLRLTTLDLLDEDGGWSSSQLSADPRDDAVQNGIPAPRDAGQVSSRGFTTRIDIARGFEGPWLPAPAEPRQVDVSGPWRWDADSATVFSARSTLSEIDDAYTVVSSRIQPTAEELRAASDVPAEIAETYAERPVLSPYVARLLNRITAGAETGYDKVAALQALFRDPANGFSYDTDATAPGFDQPDALERFLRAQQGFCVQYASAMGAMVRALGIPARVAVGFTPGSRTPDGTYEVTTNNAHAWPEVWFAGAGWVRFEPTPRDAQVTTPAYTQPPVDQPVTDVAEPAPGAQPEALAPSAPSNPGAVDRGDDLGASAGRGDDGGMSRGSLAALIAAAWLVVLLALPPLLATARRRHRWSSPGPLVAWAQVRDDAMDVGHVWRSTDSPRAAAAHLVSGRSLPAPTLQAMHRLAAAAERARYARPGTAGDADIAQLRSDVRQVRRGLLAGSSRLMRCSALLAPSSTLRWAGAGLGSATANALDRFDGAVSALGQRVRRPRNLLRRPAA